MGQLGIRAANAIMFILCCFLVAGVVNRIIADRLAPNYSGGMYEDSVARVEQPQWDQRKVILDRNLFGANVAAPPAKTPPSKPSTPAPPPPQEPVAETRLPLKLLGTMAAQPMHLSTAVIQNTRARKHEVVQVGDHIKDHDSVIVLAIEPRRVILKNGEKLEELVLEESDKLASGGAPGNLESALGARKGPAKSIRKRRTSRTPRARRTSSRKTRTARDLAGLNKRGTATATPSPSGKDDTGNRTTDMLAQKAQEILSSARILPAYDENGEMNGVSLSQIEDGSVLDDLGFANDSHVIRVNDLTISSPADATRIMAEFSRPGDKIVEVCVDPACSQTREIPISESQIAEFMGNQ